MTDKIVAPLDANVKPGFFTSEFFSTMVAMVATLIGVIAKLLPPEWAAIALAISGGLYTLGRSWLKTAAIGAST